MIINPCSLLCEMCGSDRFSWDYAPVYADFLEYTTDLQQSAISLSYNIRAVTAYVSCFRCTPRCSQTPLGPTLLAQQRLFFYVIAIITPPVIWYVMNPNPNPNLNPIHRHCTTLMYSHIFGCHSVPNGTQVPNEVPRYRCSGEVCLSQNAHAARSTQQAHAEQITVTSFLKVCMHQSVRNTPARLPPKIGLRRSTMSHFL